ncbi:MULTISPECIES: hypothetical protein [Streptomyces]|uniref:Uncharacterized protein n=2 Tax=Streptomyces TaxID=1883 RepID=A0A2N8PF76_STRNR|nr:MULTISPECIES: hypothetical protein [Streptomyces]PNE39664.1 hypothetical protein AOB60_30075 [Streptomyces noursei]QRX96600.1 hypothetical protein JNO44_42580 [Streptomyces noursei]UJB44673.1 hypothetical protein HRD51_31235 [Streptomyces sp. A1-5]SHL77093.1 hypothetical protein SAMN05216268_106138 [Streptomyces yunnanensis]
MEPDAGPTPDPESRRLSVIQLICRAYGLADASEITEEHIQRYVSEHRHGDERTEQLRSRLRPRIPRQRAADDAA